MPARTAEHKNRRESVDLLVSFSLVNRTEQKQLFCGFYQDMQFLLSNLLHSGLPSALMLISSDFDQYQRQEMLL